MLDNDFSMSEAISALSVKLNDADAIVIGAGAGLSTSAGFIYSGKRFEKYFSDFKEKFGISDMYSGGFMVLQLPPEIMWAYWARNIYINRYMNPPKPVYDKLLKLVQKKDYFVLTTNVDHCFQKAGFEKSRLFYTQGDYGLFQCSEPCHQATYDNEEIVFKMLEAQGYVIDKNNELSVAEGATLKMSVPTELVPLCPVCGKPMTMNLRCDDTFVEDEGWHVHKNYYMQFLEKHQAQKIVFLEAGVGQNTPTIIKVPFMRMTYQLPDATYVCLNYGEAFVPDEIKDKSICINGDIGDILSRLESIKQETEDLP